MASKKVLAFGASASNTSINQQLAEFAGKQLQGVELNIVKLDEYRAIPVFSPEEREKQVDPNVQKFAELIKSSDAIIISLAENNWTYSAVFKNLLDWLSRSTEGGYAKTWGDKPLLLLATSPMPSGGGTVLDLASKTFPILGGKVIATYSLPSFYENFKDGAIANADEKAKFDVELGKLQAVLN